MDRLDSYGLLEITLYFILIWKHADHCDHCSNSPHVHCSELLLFFSLMPIVVWSDFLLWWHQALSPAASIVSKHLVMFTWHYCRSHSLCLDMDYCYMWPIVLCSINTGPCNLWSTITFWLCSSLCSSSGYGPCPQQLNQDFKHTCIFPMWVSFRLSSLLVASWMCHCLCWGLTCLAQGCDGPRHGWSMLSPLHHCTSYYN